MRRTNNARRGLGIRGQLMFFLCFICLFLLVLFWILSTQLLEPLYTRHIERQLTTQAENVVSQLDDALAEGTTLSSWSFGRLYVNTGFFDKLAMDLYSKGALSSFCVVRSPGMKYKHYAPKADVTLLNGTFEQFKAYVDAHMDQNPSCLCFTGEAEKLGVPCVEYGREGDGADQAKHIFRSLRALDEQGDAVVYARCPQKDGLSMAVYNRLIRAAAFRVIKL